jgi:uncharacterized protein
VTEATLRPLADTAPCVGCGLCCNGTLYARAKVTPGEEPTLLEHGLTLTSEEDRTYFRLPCHHESCGRCTIYEQRFDICRSFRCALLRSYQASEIGLPEARDKVERALQLLSAVKADDPAAALFVERNRIRKELSDQLSALEQEERNPVARRLLKIVALDSYLERWFRNKKSQEGAEPDTSGWNS